MRQLALPNVRRVIIPDPDYYIFDADLAGADAQVVAWEAEDEDLMEAFRSGLDVHIKNAEDMYGSAFTQLTGAARKAKRKECKTAVHLTNYGGHEATLAASTGWTRKEAADFQRRWFSIHPKIKTNFIEKIDRQLALSRVIHNKFGFRREFFDRPDQCLPEALAWIPQSTVALTTYLGWFQFSTRHPYAEILLQVHDSLVFQIPRTKLPTFDQIRHDLRIVIPYDDPLTIPWGLKYSAKSWGECKEPEVGK